MAKVMDVVETLVPAASPAMSVSVAIRPQSLPRVGIRAALIITPLDTEILYKDKLVVTALS